MKLSPLLILFFSRKATELYTSLVVKQFLKASNHLLSFSSATLLVFFHTCLTSGHQDYMQYSSTDLTNLGHGGKKIT